ncbi:UL16-binding protein 3-like [Aotus nancymaae]|uniref:UL16-binding protein 3-like n=1 Tax=Aotus nancymaae TaxID=37293 RepID=UPI0030FE6071
MGSTISPRVTLGTLGVISKWCQLKSHKCVLPCLWLPSGVDVMDVSGGPMVRGLLSPPLLLSGMNDPPGPSATLPKASGRTDIVLDFHAAATLAWALLSAFCSFLYNPPHTHSLWYNFTIIHLPRPGQQWCEVQGQVDQKNFLSYDCGSDKVLSVGHQEGQLDATDACERQLEVLREVGQRLRLELPGIALEDCPPSGPVTLQARMSCECEADGHIHGSWEFGFHGQKFLLFDSNNRKWAVVHAGASRMKEKWEEDRELTVFFRKVSLGDCGSWLRDFPMHREKSLEPTALLTVSSGTAQLRATTTTLMLCCLCLILPCFLLPGI